MPLGSQELCRLLCFEQGFLSLPAAQQQIKLSVRARVPDDDSEDEAASSGVVPKTSKIESVAASSSGVVLRLAMQRVRVTFETLNIPQPEEICLIMLHILEPLLTDLRTLSKDEPCSTR